MYQRDDRSELILNNLRLVPFIAHKYPSSGFDIDELISAGYIGLIKAVDTFDTGKSVKLVTYASKCIHNEILQLLRRKRRSLQTISLDAPISYDEDGNAQLLSSVLGTDPDIVYRDLIHAEELATLRRAVDHLSIRDRQLIYLRYGLGGGITHNQVELAQIFGISQSYVSRRERRILSVLREAMDIYA